MIFSILSTVLVAYGIYTKVSYNRVDLRRKEILEGIQKVPLKQKVMRFGDRLVNQKLKGRLETIGVDTGKYITQTLLFIAVTPLLTFVAFSNVVFGVLGLGLGYLLSYLYYSSVYQSWKKDIEMDVPELVTYLKIRLKTGDIVAKAVESIAPLLKRGMAAEWSRIINLTNSGMPLESSLMSFSQRIENRDLTAVLVRLVAYSKEGVPKDPFGDLSEHMNHLQAMQKRYKIRRATTPMTVYAGISMMTAMIVGMVPYFYSIFANLMGTLPAGTLGH